jgi:hypothetical protein
MSFSDHQIRAIEIAERVGSVLSLVGAAFIITTFLTHKSFHKPINRLVFYAAFGNIMSNVGTLVSTSGIDFGVNSSLCQFQAFLIQWYVNPASRAKESPILSVLQVYARRCPMDFCHGVQCLLDILSKIRCKAAPFARVEIRSFLLRHTVHSGIRLFLCKV